MIDLFFRCLLHSLAMKEEIRVTGLYRYAVKGLSGDPLESVHFGTAGETFPDDRRYALLYERNRDKFNGKDWLHKENFLCAFTDPALMASMHSTYEIVVNHEAGGTTERILQIHDRSTQETLLSKTNLATAQGRMKLAQFLSEKSGQKVLCVTADKDEDQKSGVTTTTQSDSSSHRFQFGNTSSGYKLNQGDTRTMHIINQNTVNAVSEAIGIPLDARRFRPNIVIDGPPAFQEFDWVANPQQSMLVTADGHGRIRPLSRTVRCRGISLDPHDPTYGNEELDMPALLAKHFPQHGPYLGIYACLDQAPCSIRVGDKLRLQQQD